MKNLLFFFLVLSSFFGFSQSGPDKIVGVYLTAIEDAKIEIYKKGAKYHGRVVWLAEPKDEDGKPLVDKYNPNPALQSRPILNMDILTNFVYDDGEYVDGFIYDPKEGEIYDCKMWVEGDKLKVRGYLGWLFETKTWSLIK